MGDNSFLTNLKVAWAWVITMVSTSLGSLLDVIPEDVGKIGVVLTIVVSFILIRVQCVNLRNHRLVNEIKTLELEQLKREMSEREEV